jgi:hypothetical protein
LTGLDEPFSSADSAHESPTSPLEKYMTIEVLLYIGAVFHLAWAVFDFFWPQIFDWKNTLASLDDLQRILPPLTSRMLVVLYLGIAYISLFHTEELLVTDLGRTVLIFVSVYWAVRAILQVRYIGFRKANEFNVSLSSYAPSLPVKNVSNRTISIILLIEFIVASALYLIPSTFGR